MKHVFANNNPVLIDEFKPTDVSSAIEVSNITGNVERVNVSIDVHHTYTSDLKISLVGPEGQEALLVGREGGSGDNFIDTAFDDGSTTLITDASAPFSGTFRPESSLSAFKGTNPNGIWSLRVVDVAFLDGGSLNHWSLSLTVEDQVQSSFSIDVRFLGGLTQNQMDVFETAAARWSEIIVGDLPGVIVNGEVVDDVLIEASGKVIDGPSGILGQARPTSVRPGSLLPATGIMEFDIGDLANMENDGSLVNVIIHEMCHALGLGTLWSLKGFLAGAGTANPIFTGLKAMQEFALLRGVAAPTPVSVANTGGPGTRDGHWREGVFGNELMTGFLNTGFNPVSRMTIASLEDLGYAVNYNAADPFILPSSLELAIMGIGAEGGYGRRHCCMCGHRAHQLTPVILPESAFV